VIKQKMQEKKPIEHLLKAYKDNQRVKDAIRLIQHTNQSVFLTGRAGTGKTTLLKLLAKNIDKRHIILAPDELTAINAGGAEIHSFFGFERTAFLPETKNIPKLSREKTELLHHTDLIIIDEVSMVRCDIMNLIDLTLRINLNSNQPFGGKQLLMAGDLYQLPPLLDEEDKQTVILLRSNYSSRYFFSAKAFEKSYKYHIVELTKVYRQQEESFINLLEAIRINKVSNEHLSKLNERFGVNGGLSTNYKVTLFSTEEESQKLNNEYLSNIDSPLINFRAVQSGEVNINGNYPADTELKIKDGAQVMFIINDPKGRWQNGTIGKISNIFEDLLEVEYKVGNNIIKQNIERYTWNKYSYSWNSQTENIDKHVKGRFTQFPVRLAWGTTVQKSRGQTFEHVIINPGRKAYSSGLTYVALSRCKSLKGITLVRPVQKEDIFTDKRISRFLESKKRSVNEEKFDKKERIDQQYHIISSLENQNISFLQIQKEQIDALVEQTKKIEWQNTDLESAKGNLKENEAKLGQAFKKIAELEEEIILINKSKGNLQIFIVILTIAILCLLLT
jgi:ATP-dependent DNA helicase PIF1